MVRQSLTAETLFLLVPKLLLGNEGNTPNPIRVLRFGHH
jgi:hypothetical protein